MWPHYDAVAKRCAKLYEDYKAGRDITQYATKGDDKRVIDMKSTKRNESPMKGTGVANDFSGSIKNSESLKA